MNKLISTRLSNDNTVDREVETAFILKIIEGKTADLLILYAQSGVGKSTLSNRVLRIVPEYIPICVRTSPENNNKLQPEGTFLEKVFNCFVSFFYLYKDEYPKYCFDYYVSHNKNISIKREALENMFSSVSTDDPVVSAGISVTKYITSRLCKLYEYNSLNRLHLSTKESMLIAHEYIKYVLRNANICLNIDNLQNIDYYSLQLIIEWISISARNSFFLLEYTIDNTGKTESLVKFASHFQSIDLDVQLLPLGGLDVENAISAVKKAYPDTKTDNNFFEEVKAFYIHHSNGNMQKLLDFSLKYTANSILQKSYDPTYEKLSLVKSNGKYILAIIVMHGGEIESSLLHHIVLSSITPLIFDYDNQIDKLIHKYELIEEKNNYYVLKHATLTDAWHNHQEELNRFNILAYKNCCLYYNRVLEKDFSDQENSEQALLFLLRVYSKYEPEKIIEIIDQMNNMVSERIRPEQIFEYFQIFLAYIKNDEANHCQVLYKMMYFCFNHGLFKNCLYIIQILDAIDSETGKFVLFVYKINCIEYLELHTDAIVLCENRLKDENDDRCKYICYLLLMGCYRSINQMDKVMLYVDKIRSIPNFTEIYEYGIFLRLSEIYMDRSAALPDVEKSVSFYKGKNRLLETKSRITYSFLLAVTDDLDKAEEQLNMCLEIDNATHYWDSILYLNKASIFILRRNFGSEVDSLLKKAELATNSSFDLLLILTLQMINAYEMEHTLLNDYLLKRIARLLSHESDKHLIALVAYNLYLYYKKIGNEKLSHEYRTIAEKTCKHNRTVEHHLRGTKDTNTPNLFHIDWCIGFTFFWNVDYDDNVSA